ncbi:MAG: ribonuclease H [Nitrososphaerales archaeon]
MDEVQAWVDGSTYVTNPGPGGSCAILIFPDGSTLGLVAHEEESSSSRAKLRAATIALRYFKQPTRLTLYSDSKYTLGCLGRWRYSWQRNGMRTASGNPVKNQDLIKQLWKHADKHDLQLEWVEGRTGHRWNEAADYLAKRMSNQIPPKKALGRYAKTFGLNEIQEVRK